MADDMDDARGDAADAVRWMTYRELADVRGISLASATRLAFRRKWRRQGGNDKTARVAVPIAEARPRPDKPMTTGMASGVTTGDDITHVVRVLEGALAGLTEQLGRERDRADKAEAAVETAQQRVTFVETRAEAAMTRATTAEAELAALRTADEVRRARGVFARLKAAVRGA